MRLTLIALSYSPWSEKARWALDHHRLAFREVEHVPMIGAPLLRLRTKQLTGRVTVPVLLEDGEALFDSLSIARRADAIGAGSSLFPSDHVAAIEGWVRRGEALLQAGRARLVERTLVDRAALREALPPAFPAAIRPAMESVARLGAHFLAVKYRTRTADVQAHLEHMREVLLPWQEQLRENEYCIPGHFTFADIAAATALQMVKPVDDTWIALGAATRIVWTEPELARDFVGLLAWRDWLYATHRRPGAAHTP